MKLKSLDSLKINEIEKKALINIVGGKQYSGSVGGSAYTADLVGTREKCGTGELSVTVGPFSLSYGKDVYCPDLKGDITYDGFTIKGGTWGKNVILTSDEGQLDFAEAFGDLEA